MDKSKLQAEQVYVTRQFLKRDPNRPDSKMVPVGEAQQTDETVAVHRFVTEPARVSVEMGMTVNLSNYESARIAVALHVPCYFEEHEQAYEYAKNWVEKRCLEEATEARRFAQGRTNSF